MGYRALHWASAKGHLDCVKVLMSAKADADAKLPQQGGAKPLQIAIRHREDTNSEASPDTTLYSSSH